MTQPKYRAYKPVDMTDGLQNWIQHTFDNTVEWTTDDEKMFVDVSINLTPNTRITSMQARLDSLKNITPAIKVHADAIRAIHDGLDNHFSINYEGMIGLQRADELWAKIVLLRDLLPKAITGEKFTRGRRSGTGGPIRKAIARLLKNNPELNNKILWNAIKDKPPRRWQVFENSLGKYIEGPTPDKNMAYRRFINVAAEERKKLSD